MEGKAVENQHFSYAKQATPFRCTVFVQAMLCSCFKLTVMESLAGQYYLATNKVNVLLIVMVAFINHVNAMNVQSGSKSVSERGISFGVKKLFWLTDSMC